MKALIVHGGWDGHQPKQVAELYSQLLQQSGFTVEISDTLDSFLELEKLLALDLICPVWTMGKITEPQLNAVTKAVASGVGLAGCHGGLCDSFREATEWQFMTGGQWVAHPGNDGVKHRIYIKDLDHPITQGIADFDVVSEQYYLHIDPAVHVLASTLFPLAEGPHATNGQVVMPQIWTKRYGQGRVYYNALGHHVDILEVEPVRTLIHRGLLWAAEGKKLAK